MNTNQMIDRVLEIQKAIFANTATDAQKIHGNQLLVSLRRRGVTLRITTIVAGKSRLIEVLDQGRVIQEAELDR